MADLFPERDLRFLLEDVLGLPELLKAPRWADHDLDTVRSVLEVARQVAGEVWAPLAREVDEHEARLVDGRVVLAPAVKTAVDAYVAAGFVAAPFDAEDGGMQLPYLVNMALLSTFAFASTPLTSYPGLTMAAAGLLRAHGSQALRDQWLRPMIEGRFFGTMALSEPQAGSSLSDLLTVATPADDGTWRLVGQKMWITAADHDLSENIVHFVLARLRDAPPGTRGISLFLVPKLLPDGTPNDVRVVGVNHKMGYRAAVNTAFSLGDQGGAIGWMVGEPNQGLRCMFHMMNEARIAVGLGAATLAWAGFRHSLAFAKDRPQGRPATVRDPRSPQVPIVEHADVRRLLLSQKAIAEGALGLALRCAKMMDEKRAAEDAGDAREAERLGLLLDVLTPIVKAWNSEFGLRANEDAIQVLGGSGYTREYPVERLYRDNRLNPIHEGTNGIQALDLLGRKVLLGNGAAAAQLLAVLNDVVARSRAAGPVAAELGQQLNTAIERLATVTGGLVGVAMRDPDLFLANATPYLHLAGHTVVAWIWLEQVLVAEPGAAGDPFLQGKLQAARYFFRWELPKTAHWASLLGPVERTPLDTRPEWL